MDRGRLSVLERGYGVPTAAEKKRLEKALEELIEAKQRMVAAAAECGWPVGAL
jgi:hypothetical protein